MVSEKPVESAASASEEDLSWLSTAPRGTVWISPDESHAFCAGSEQPYWIPLPALTCECKAAEFGNTSCFHVEAVKAKLRERHPCPLCDGFVMTRLEFHEGKGFLMRATCASEECSYVRVV
jgi:hypothetical protein